MELLVVLLIVGGALFYLIRRGWAAVSSRNEVNCACGCSGCDAVSTCEEKDQA